VILHILAAIGAAVLLIVLAALVHEPLADAIESRKDW